MIARSRTPNPLAHAALLLGIAGLIACGPQLTPTLGTVSGRTVELVEAGTGPGTVVFESGLGDDWSRWDLVAGPRWTPKTGQ
jgi:hypothetical protein